MNKIEKLINELCPDGVEYQKLGDVAEIKRGNSITKKNIIEGNIPVIAGGRKPAYYHNKSNRTGKTIAIAGSGAYAGFISWWEIPIFVSDAFTVKPDNNKLLSKYCFYWFQMMQSKIYTFKTGSGIPHVYPRDIIPLQIPTPPLEIQKQIVEILDKFTSITAELTAELNLRKKQYNYYRDKLLTFDKDDKSVQWKKLGDVLNRTKGTKITASQMKEINKENAPLKIFAGGQTVAFVNFDDIPKKDINKNVSVIVKSRGIIEFEYYDKPFSHKNEMWAYNSTNKNVDIKFVYYLLKNNENSFQRIASKMQMPQISTPDTDKYLIPIPPLEKQQEIVNILDKFDTLTNSISEGLPKEIELRQKQYEYYRDKLLTFPKKQN